MNKFKLPIYYLLIIPMLFFEGFASLKITAQPPTSPRGDSQPFVKCREIKNNRIDQFASDNQFLILSETDGNIRQINRPDYTQNWNIQIGSKLESIPYLKKTDILLLSSNEESKTGKNQAIIRQIDSLTGVTSWITHLEPFAQFLLIQKGNTENITLISEKLNVRQIDSKNGKTLWSVDLKEQIRTYTSSEDLLFILSTDDNLFQLRLSDGTIISEDKIRLKNISNMSYKNGSLLLGNGKGVLYELSENSKAEKKLFRTGGKISSIINNGDDLLVVSNDNFIYYFSTEKKRVLWKKRLSGRVILKPVIFQDLIFTTTPVEPVIYIFSVTDGALINRINLDDNHFIKQMKVNESGLDVLTTAGLVKFGVTCQN